MENIFTFYNILDKKHYTVASHGDLLCLQEDDAAPGSPCKHFVKVVPDYEYTYKVQKTQIKASGGVEGLINFMKESDKLDGLFICGINQIIQKILSGEVKAAK